ncbi:MAG: S-methyl-5'-thioinosine phosphorylase [Nitrospirae bacterium]|nr:S-methyl-5'-thioinosine phosphorylase [Nitrospirota bacterium]
MLKTNLPKFDVVIIGGLGFHYPDSNNFDVNTPYGTVKLKRISINHHGKQLELALIQRHANNESDTGEHLPPHMLNYRANVWAVKAIGAQRVIATNSVGTMGDHMPGSFFIPDNFVDFTKSRHNTFYDNETVHVDMTDPYCHEIRDSLLKALYQNHLELNSGVYVCTEGPRFETPAEIKMFSSFGDVVGMTGLPEVVLAKELGLCYASICIITNKASGLSGNKLTADEVIEILDVKLVTLQKVVLDAVTSLTSPCKCNCRSATDNARVP